MTQISTTAAPLTLTDDAIVAERRRGRRAGVAGLGAVACTVAAIAVDGRATHQAPGTGDLARQLRSLDADLAPHLIALGIRVAGLALTAWLALFLTRAVRDRAGDAPRALRTLAIAAAASAAFAFVVGVVAMHHVAGGFPARGTEDAAQSLVRHDAAMRGVALLELGVHVVTGIWASLLCLWAVRVGLLPRFVAVWGIGAGVAGVLMPVGDSLLLGWVGSVAVLALGWWPEGRPPAWDAGRPVPWSEVDAQRARTWRPPTADEH